MEETERSDRQARLGSDYLRTQVRAWMEGAGESGRKKELFELEMWLRALDRFFKPALQLAARFAMRELDFLEEGFRFAQRHAVVGFKFSFAFFEVVGAERHFAARAHGNELNGRATLFLFAGLDVRAG